nr:hypothetical protein [Tanacetum cinerariifolium]
MARFSGCEKGRILAGRLQLRSHGDLSDLTMCDEFDAHMAIMGNDDIQTIIRFFLIGKCQTSMRLGKATLPNREAISWQGIYNNAAMAVFPVRPCAVMLPLSWLGSRTRNVNADVAGSGTVLFDLLQVTMKRQ